MKVEKCPGCKKEPILAEWGFNDGKGKYACSCVNLDCGNSPATVYGETQKECAENWNKEARWQARQMRRDDAWMNRWARREAKRIAKEGNGK